MYRFLTKFIVAYLVLLGDSAFAAEYHYDNKNENGIESYSSQLSPSTQLEQAYSHVSSFYNDLDLTYSTHSAHIFVSSYIDYSHIIPSLLNHSDFSPRAPPQQHNTI